MCEPVSATAGVGAALGSMGGAAMAASSFSWFSIASMAASAIGTVVQGVSGMQQSRYQAAVARNNSIIAERAAKDALERGSIAEDNARKRTGLIIGSQRAALAGQGSALDEGSPLDIQGDTAVAGEMDALTIRSNAEREAYNYRAQGANFRAQEQLASSQAGWLGTGASLLAGASGVADRWARYRSAGML